MPDILALAWPEFLREVNQVTEEACWEALAMEKSGKNRLAYLQRLYGRANSLRTRRERREWLGD